MEIYEIKQPPKKDRILVFANNRKDAREQATNLATELVSGKFTVVLACNVDEWDIVYHNNKAVLAESLIP